MQSHRLAPAPCQQNLSRGVKLDLVHIARRCENLHLAGRIPHVPQADLAVQGPGGGEAVAAQCKKTQTIGAGGQGRQVARHLGQERAQGLIGLERGGRSAQHHLGRQEQRAWQQIGPLRAGHGGLCGKLARQCSRSFDARLLRVDDREHRGNDGQRGEAPQPAPVSQRCRRVVSRRLARRYSRCSSVASGRVPWPASTNQLSAAFRLAPRSSRLRSRAWAFHSLARTSTRVCWPTHSKSVSMAVSTAAMPMSKSSESRMKIQFRRASAGGADRASMSRLTIGTMRLLLAIAWSSGA